MRQAITIHKINEGTKVIIDNYGTITMIHFADILFKAGKIDLKTRNSSKTIRLTSEYATRLLNENLDLFPIEF